MTNILIVDDNPDDLRLYSELIGAAGDHYTVFTATSAEEALSLFERYPIDCAFIDFHMPDANGLRTIERLQEKVAGRALPLVLFTGDGSQKIQAEAARRGAMDYMVKDMESTTPEQIDLTIRKVIAWADDLNKNRIRVN
ncbi:response regulator [Rhizobium halophytocola]|uniref:CheY-like chemotaxis protein n=1 Tax=Rhizobium halophytocola TaxID=735519 RepID=A0ABS4E6H6_9HYPH|nr:response regulator [Rhizobium halophytocola]MBP1853546.1 CheY-like chemotaxis protein [Rhizobium halophytocola]